MLCLKKNKFEFSVFLKYYNDNILYMKVEKQYIIRLYYHLILLSNVGPISCFFHFIRWKRTQSNILYSRGRFPGSTASDIYLGENTCTGILTGRTLVFDYDIHSCLSSESVSILLFIVVMA